MTWKLFDSGSPLIIQGMTGKEGSRMAGWLIASGSNVVAGVTPGKGGQSVEGRPIFNSVAEAKAAFPAVEISSIAVPAPFVLSAVNDAIEAGMRFIHILTEQVPVHDVMRMKEIARAKGATILGPSSVGYIQFPQFRMGYLGGESPFSTVQEGSVAIVSTSGGMTNELLMALTRNGVGVRLAFALGGDRVIGTTLEDAIRWSESCPEVASIAIFIEPGRPLLKALISGTFNFTKPAIVFLAGEALDDMPRGLPYGHTGTILGEDEMSVREIRKTLSERGIMCVGTMSEFIQAYKSL
ncbi:MAG: CoA-binding protein [Patescibacteria group bacterium]